MFGVHSGKYFSYIWNEKTLDHDDELDDEDIEDPLPSTSTDEHLDPIKDTDYEPIDEYNL